MGRPPYAPGDLLKLYIYGYLHRIRASRRLEAETHRNVQVMWLINRLTPAFKTIADFRKDHPRAIVGACRSFIRLLPGAVAVWRGIVGDRRDQDRRGGEPQAGDHAEAKIAKMNEAIDRKIAEYLAAMDQADRQEPRADRRSQCGGRG